MEIKLLKRKQLPYDLPQQIMGEDKILHTFTQSDVSKTILTYGAFEKDCLTGVICFDLEAAHVCFVWLAQECHASVFFKLIETAENLCKDDLSVYADRYCKWYQEAGFQSNGESFVVGAKEYQPLIKKIERKKQFTNYEEVYDFINSQKDRVYSLDHFQRYMQDLGDPQLALKCIHIGGTNGKGSTTNYIKEVLLRAGYRVGTFTSPALKTRLDVIRINDRHIDEQFMVDIANRYVDRWLEYEISLFEIEMFIAVMYYLYQGVDIAVFEVGLGGELDATNIIYPLVALNTNIGLDHIEYLGDSYESIATAKAGIIKDGVDFITGEDKQECLDIFKEACEKHHSELIRVERIHDIQDGENVKYTYKGYNIVLDSPALYQIKNSALAIEALLYLKEKNEITFGDDDLIYGLFEAKWAGRFEKLRDDPLIIIDGAHNREGIDELYRAARKFHDLKIIFSALKDKDTDYMIERLLELTYDITVCEFEHPRAQKAELLAKDYPVKVEPDYFKAIDEAFDHQGTLLITGSLYFIAKVRPYLQEKIKNS